MLTSDQAGPDYKAALAIIAASMNHAEYAYADALPILIAEALRGSRASAILSSGSIISSIMRHYAQTRGWASLQVRIADEIRSHVLAQYAKPKPHTDEDFDED